MNQQLTKDYYSAIHAFISLKNNHLYLKLEACITADNYWRVQDFDNATVMRSIAAGCVGTLVLASVVHDYLLQAS